MSERKSPSAEQQHQPSSTGSARLVGIALRRHHLGPDFAAASVERDSIECGHAALVETDGQLRGFRDWQAGWGFASERMATKDALRVSALRNLEFPTAALQSPDRPVTAQNLLQRSRVAAISDCCCRNATKRTTDLRPTRHLFRPEQRPALDAKSLRHPVEIVD